MIFTLLLQILFGIIHIILIPIDALISTFIPNMSELTAGIEPFFEYIMTNFAWAGELVFVNDVVIGLLVVFITFKFTAPAIAWVIKLTIKWYRAIKG